MSDDISIAVNDVSHPILCGTCQKPIAFIGESNADGGEAGCASCGNIADVQEVARMALDYAKDEAQLIVNRAMRDTARGSKVIRFEGKTTHDKHHRFVIDLKL